MLLFDVRRPRFVHRDRIATGTLASTSAHWDDALRALVVPTRGVDGFMLSGGARLRLTVSLSRTSRIMMRWTLWASHAVCLVVAFPTGVYVNYIVGSHEDLVARSFAVRRVRCLVISSSLCSTLCTHPRCCCFFSRVGLVPC